MCGLALDPGSQLEHARGTKGGGGQSEAEEGSAPPGIALCEKKGALPTPWSSPEHLTRLGGREKSASEGRSLEGGTLAG